MSPRGMCHFGLLFVCLHFRQLSQMKLLFFCLVILFIASVSAMPEPEADAEPWRGGGFGGHRGGYGGRYGGGYGGYGGGYGGYGHGYGGYGYHG